MMETGKMIKKMEMAYINGKMEMYIKDFILMIKNKEKEVINLKEKIDLKK